MNIYKPMIHLAKEVSTIPEMFPQDTIQGIALHSIHQNGLEAEKVEMSSCEVKNCQMVYCNFSNRQDF